MTIIKAVDVNADGVFNGTDIATFAKYLVGGATLATVPYVAS